MTALVERLLAAIAETERIARDAMGDPNRQGAGVWIRECGHLDFEGEALPPSHDLCCVVEGDIHIYDEGGHDGYQADHIARHDPFTELRRCAADRKIVELHEPQGAEKYGKYCGECGGTDYPVSWPCPTLRNLAEGYGLIEENT